MAIKTVQMIINGQTVNLTYNTNTSKWEGTTTSPGTSSYTQSGHYYPATLKVTDEAGNLTTKDDTDSTIGSSLRLVVKEKVAPITTIAEPTAGATIISNKPTIRWSVTDNDSGVNPDTIGITIDSGTKIMGTAITKTAIANGYTCSYVPASALGDGQHTIKADATDYDGNAAVQKSVTCTIDTVPPTLSITSPIEGLITNVAAITVIGTTNDATSSPCTVTIKLNAAAAQSVTVAANGSFNKALTLIEGANTISVVSTDSAGKSTTVTRNVTLDTVAPTISTVTLTPNPVDCGKTYVITVTCTD